MFNVIQNRNDSRYHHEEYNIETEILIDNNDVDDDSDYENEYNYKVNNVNFNQVYNVRKVKDRDETNHDHNNIDNLQQQVKQNINISLKNNNLIYDIVQEDIHHVKILHDIIIDHCICSYSVDIIRELFYEMLALYMVSSDNHHHHYFLESKDMKKVVNIHRNFVEIIDEEEDMFDDIQPRIPLDADEYDENNYSYDHDDDKDKVNHKKILSTTTAITIDFLSNTMNLCNRDSKEKDKAMESNFNSSKNNNNNNININNKNNNNININNKNNNNININNKNKNNHNNLKMISLVRGEGNNVKGSSSSSKNSNNNNHIKPDDNDGDNDDDNESPIAGSHNNNNNSSSSINKIPLFFRIPQLLTGIIFKERVDDMINLNGDESKYDLIQEMAVHILIDSLLLTVTAVPIVSLTIPTDCNHFICRISVSLTYITFNMQLWTVTLHAIIAFTLLEIPNKLFKDWLIHRKEVLYTVARMHVCGLYIFVMNIFIWPLAKYNTFYQVICTLTSFFVWVVVFLMMGTAVTDGVFDALNPTIKLKGKPYNKKIKAIIESDKNIFQNLFLRETKRGGGGGGGGGGGEKKKIKKMMKKEKCVDMNTFLNQLHLNHLLPIFKEEKINIKLLSMLDHHDFSHLHISIADRIKIYKALHHSPSSHHLLHLYHHQKK